MGISSIDPGNFSQYGGYSGYGYASAVPSRNAFANSDAKALKRSGAIECQTCKSRTYQDVSNDPGVSFKAPGHIDPASSGAAVMSHEQEHVSNARASASSKGGRILSQSVRLFTSVCPECGRTYVSGGETRTVTETGGNKRTSPRYSNNSAGSSGRYIDFTV